MAEAMHYVILGNGVCGFEAGLALRARDARARISLVSGSTTTSARCAMANLDVKRAACGMCGGCLERCAAWPRP